MLCSIQITLMLTPLGFVTVGPLLRITTLHIPVILAGVLLGTKAGAILGLLFGLGSVITNTLTPGPISFVFTPFYSLGEYHGNVLSLVIAIVPRVLLGVLSALIYKKLTNKKFGSFTTAVSCTLIHSFMVLGLIYLFFGPAYASAANIESSRLLTALLITIFTNGLFEAVLAGAVVTGLTKVLEPIIKKVM